MKQEDYMNKARFPMTSQEGLEYSKQKMIDSFNYDQLIEGLALKEVYTKEQYDILTELEFKLGRDRETDVRAFLERNKK